jgi:RHS repeat-associated protein
VYDGFGDRIQVASPDSGTTVFHFDPDGNLTQKLTPSSLTATYTYDAMDRMKTAAFTGDTTLNQTLTYDQTGHGFGIGRLTSVTDQVGTLALTYDERGNTTKEVRTPTGAKAITTSYGFDAASHLASITYPSTLQVIYARDTMGRVDSVTAKLPGSSTVHNILTGITYEPFGPMSAGTYGNSVGGTYGYDLDYRPTTRHDSGTASITNLTYNYYPTDNVSSISDAVNAANSQNFNYDSFGHLTSATSGTGGYPSESISWDHNDNVTYASGATNTTFTLATTSNQLASITVGSTLESITTTPAGNISAFTSGSTTLQSYSYNKANQLASAANGSHTATYQYDFAGRRLEGNGSVSGKTYYQYGPNNNLLENQASTGTANVDYIYLDPQAGAGAQPVGTYQKGNNTLYYAHTDRLGTPQALTDSTQAVKWSALYQPFGTVQSTTGTAIQNLRMPGQENDADVGLYHNGFRDYAPSLTRYLQTDPIGLSGGMNTYQYVSGNPIKLIDPSGLSPDQMCYPWTLACPSSEPAGSPEWRPYWGVGGQTIFHCGGTAYLENRSPSFNGPINECVYDQNHNLISPYGPDAECAGTPDYYDDAHPFKHFFMDPGGVFNFGTVNLDCPMICTGEIVSVAQLSG